MKEHLHINRLTFMYDYTIQNRNRATFLSDKKYLRIPYRCFSAYFISLLTIPLSGGGLCSMLCIGNGNHDMNKSGCYFRKIHNQLEAGFNRKYKKYGLTSTQTQACRSKISGTPVCNLFSSETLLLRCRYGTRLRIPSPCCLPGCSDFP